MTDAKKYQRIRERFFFVGLALDLALLVVFQVSGVSQFFKDIAERASDVYALQAFLYLTFFFNVFFFLLLPLQYASGYRLEKRFGLSNETFARWATDELKKYALTFVFFIVTGEGFLLLVRAFPDAWWFFAAAGYVLFTFLLAFLFPILILPLFYRTQELPSGELKNRVLALCRECGLHVMGVYEISFSEKTKKANAALVGLGKSRRILLTDTLTAGFPLPEIEMVVAHEIGHHAEKHILRGFVFNAAVVFAGLYALWRLSGELAGSLGADGLSDLRVFPVLVLLSSLGGFFLMPAQNAFSRSMERAADRFALRKRPDKEVFVSLMRRLGERNLADPEPRPWVEFLLYDHPSIKKRIDQALSFSA